MASSLPDPALSRGQRSAPTRDALGRFLPKDARASDGVSAPLLSSGVYQTPSSVTDSILPSSVLSPVVCQAPLNVDDKDPAQLSVVSQAPLSAAPPELALSEDAAPPGSSDGRPYSDRRPMTATGPAVICL